MIFGTAAIVARAELIYNAGPSATSLTVVRGAIVQRFRLDTKRSVLVASESELLKNVPRSSCDRQRVRRLAFGQQPRRTAANVHFPIQFPRSGSDLFTLFRAAGD